MSGLCAATTMGETVTERKVKPDGSVREYACRPVHWGARFAMVAFALSEGASGFGIPVAIPPGTTSLGFFWSARPYNVYRFVAPDGGVLGHRFDAVAGVRIDDTAITYHDLVLDWWAFPDGRLEEEDREELEELAARGVLQRDAVARAEEAARQVTSRYRHIIDEVADLARRHADAYRG